ncbi:MAG TPA: sigma 54-interacting transcriptional regulator, partial [Planctomycetota bacterium]|nr:sigma 54-interacting transcriptional regulator [Planctomycetota bacterium]
MIPEPVDLHRVRGALQAIAEARRHPRGIDGAWQSFRSWCEGRGRRVAESFDQPPLQYHQLQDLYAFGIETSPPRFDFLRSAGRNIASGLWSDRLPEFLSAGLTPSASVPEVAEALFRRFMREYSIVTYAYRASHRSGGLSVSLEYADPEAMGKYLRSHGLDPAESFRRSFLVVAATIEAVLERFVAPWNARQFRGDPETGRIEIKFAAGAGFNFHGIIGTLAERTRALESSAAERLRLRGLEQDLILRSAVMRGAWEKIRRAGSSEELILLRGEPGTGKTHLAQRIHEMSAHAGGPFVEVAMTADVGSEGLVQSQLFGHARGAFTGAHEAREGLFAQAHGGTIFLDEIGDAGPELQAKLLRVIEKKTFRPVGSGRDV